MKTTITIIYVVWVLLVATSCAWNYTRARDEEFSLYMNTARAFFDQVLLTRTWNASQGGVYVPVTREIQPNPYLIDPRREIKVNDELTLTKINPSFMTRQIADISLTRQGPQFRITSLNPLRPENRPTPLEAEALRTFEAGAREFGKVVGEDAGQRFFYMAPLLTEKACLPCHAKQGYKEGNIRGGISVTLPLAHQIPTTTLVVSHVAIGLAGLIGIYCFSVYLSKAYATVQRQAVIDALTGIPNRRNFSERILSEVLRSDREQTPLSILLSDIDNFKDYNDTYGHQAGDECLKRVAQAICLTLKRPGDFCARYGGEEFVIILPNTPLDGAQSIAEEIRQAIAQLNVPHKGSADAVVTLSLGVATRQAGNPLALEALLKQADQALYLAKHTGRNRVETCGKA